MFDELSRRYRDWRRRFRRTGLADLSPSTWRVLTIDRFQYLTAFVFVPVLIAVLIFVSNTVDALSFLLFPPLAAAAYELFANPGKPSSTAEGMVVGMTGGALSGWAAVTVDRALFGPPPAGTFELSVTATVMCVLITGVVLRLFDVDLAPSFAVALLVLLLDIPPEVRDGSPTRWSSTPVVWRGRTVGSVSVPVSRRFSSRTRRSTTSSASGPAPTAAARRGSCRRRRSGACDLAIVHRS